MRLESGLHRHVGEVNRIWTEVCMHSMVLWPLMALLAGAVVLVPTVGDSGNRSIVYWLIIPPLVAGILAAWAHMGIS